MYVKALGLIETRGFVACIEAADAMAKAADVHVEGTCATGDGLYVVTVRGTVGAVQAATEAATRAASKVGEIVSVHVIPRPYDPVESVLVGPRETYPHGWGE